MDLLVKLYDLKYESKEKEILENYGIRIMRAMTPNMHQVLEFAEKNFGKHWASESSKAFTSFPIKCFVAVDKNNEIVGFACYDSTLPDYFGPTGVREDMRGKGLGAELLYKCLLGLYEMGYGYCIIGDVEEKTFNFYNRVGGAIRIPDSSPGMYANFIRPKKN